MKKQRPQSKNKKSQKRVTFNERLLNQESLDDNTIERIHHNQLYNDDSVFDNFSIFHRLNQDDADSVANNEESKNSDLKLTKNVETNHIKVINGDEQHGHSIDQIDPSVVINEGIENKELLKEQDLADFNLWDEIESERISHQDDNEIIRDIKSNAIESNENAKDDNTVLKSLSHISMVSDRNGVVEWPTPQDMFEQKTTNIERDSTFKKQHEEDENKFDFSRKLSNVVF